MGRHIIKWAKLKFFARHYDPYACGHKGHNSVFKIQLGPFHYVATHMCIEPELVSINNHLQHV